MTLSRIDSTRPKEEVLTIAAAMETIHGQTHPFAQAILVANGDELSYRRLLPEMEALDVRAYHGIRVRHKHHIWSLGSISWLNSHSHQKINMVDLLSPEETGIALLCDDSLVARLIFKQSTRPGIQESIRQLQEQGMRIHVLSGDEACVTKRMAEQLHIDVEHVKGRQQPEDKLTYVNNLQKQGRKVWMFGDGANDAMVLSQADISTSMQCGADMTRAYADTLWVFPHLHKIGHIPKLVLRARKIARGNLVWALCYNLTMIPLAAMGYLTPWLAGLSMAGSSLFVVLNALRIMKP